MTATWALAAETGVIIAIVAASALFVLWLVTLFLIVVDDLSVGAKVVWLLVCTVLAPFGIPVYLVRRRRRTGSHAERSYGTAR